MGHPVGVIKTCFFLWRKPSTHLVTKVSEMKCPVWARKKTHRGKTELKLSFSISVFQPEDHCPGDLSGSDIPPTSPSCELLFLLHGTFWGTHLLSSLLCGLGSTGTLQGSVSSRSSFPDKHLRTQTEFSAKPKRKKRKISTPKTNICFKNTCIRLPWWSSG